ncbi:hypothetical protein SDC9_124780 [bioreactor metagenome]|uniref:Uncharacterized protein n=1 Tax=bioreactor metagenome TaxID=1076179 RepID=A0A645CLW7_9ZZZZ
MSVKNQVFSGTASFKPCYYVSSFSFNILKLHIKSVFTAIIVNVLRHIGFPVFYIFVAGYPY